MRVCPSTTVRNSFYCSRLNISMQCWRKNFFNKPALIECLGGGNNITDLRWVVLVVRTWGGTRPHIARILSDSRAPLEKSKFSSFKIWKNFENFSVSNGVKKISLANIVFNQKAVIEISGEEKQNCLVRSVKHCTVDTDTILYLYLQFSKAGK